jgi:hypothetical protein
MNVEIGTEALIFLFWEYLFQIFGILSLQCRERGRMVVRVFPAHHLEIKSSILKLVMLSLKEYYFLIPTTRRLAGNVFFFFEVHMWDFLH